MTNEELFHETLKLIDESEVENFIKMKDIYLTKGINELKCLNSALLKNENGASFEDVMQDLYNLTDYAIMRYRCGYWYFEGTRIGEVKLFLQFSKSNNNRDKFEQFVIDFEQKQINSNESEGYKNYHKELLNKYLEDFKSYRERNEKYTAPSKAPIIEEMVKE